MKQSLWQKRIPTFLGIIILVIGFFVTSYVVNNGQLLKIQASPAYTPKNIRITNLTDTSFTVSYLTEEEAVGSISYQGSDELSKIGLDDRDQQNGQPRPYFIHHITVNHLNPQQTYTFSINSKDQKFSDGEIPFSVTTLASLSSNPPQQNPIVGKVLLPDNTSNKEVLILLVRDNAQMLSVLTKPDGTFFMPLNSLRNSNFDQYYNLENNSIISLLLTNGVLSSQVKVLSSQLNPVPPISLPQNYDFTSSANPLDSTVASEAAISESFPSFSATENSDATPNTIQIITPDNKETFEDQQPSFSGVAIPNQEIEITIHSNQKIITTLKTDSKGFWTFRPEEKLEPGEHTIIVKTRNKQGVLQTLTRSFTVYAAGSQFVEPSVSPPTPTPTPKPEPIATPTPTTEPTPTPTPIIIEVTVTPLPPQDSPGSSSVIFFAILTLFTLGGGVLLFLTNRNSNTL